MTESFFDTRRLDGGQAGTKTASRALAEETAYDDLPAEARALVRRRWAREIEERRRALRLDRELSAQGYVEIDENGEVVRHEPVDVQQNDALG